MTNEEAVVYLRHYLELVNESKDNIDADYLSFLTGVHTLAIEALEKQIPRKPIFKNQNAIFDGNWKKFCPACGRLLIERVTTEDESYPIPYCTSKYCSCGQALDWSKED